VTGGKKATTIPNADTTKKSNGARGNRFTNATRQGTATRNLCETGPSQHGKQVSQIYQKKAAEPKKKGISLRLLTVQGKGPSNVPLNSQQRARAKKPKYLRVKYVYDRKKGAVPSPRGEV